MPVWWHARRLADHCPGPSLNEYMTRRLLITPEILRRSCPTRQPRVFGTIAATQSLHKFGHVLPSKRDLLEPLWDTWQVVHIMYNLPSVPKRFQQVQQLHIMLHLPMFLCD